MRLRDSVELALIIGCLVGLVQASMDVEYRIHNVGNIKGVGVAFFFGVDCMDEAETINWGKVSAGGYSEALLYALNVGSEPITLSYVTENWEPAAAENYFLFSWSYDGSLVAPSQAVAIMFQLTVLSSVNVVGSFSFDIVVTATEAR